MKTVSNKTCTENQNTHFMPTDFFRKSCRLRDVEKCGEARGATNDVTIRRIRVACWISKATRTHAHAHAHAHTQICNIYCFSTATMIRERVSELRYTYIA